MKDAPYYKLRSSGRVNGQKYASLMNVSRDIVEIDDDVAKFTDDNIFASVKENIARQFHDLAKVPVPIQKMDIAEVMTWEQIVTAEDIASGEFEGFEIGDTYTEEMTFGVWPVELG